MTPARLVSRSAAAVLVVAIAIMAADYARARIRAGRDAQTLAALQRQVEADRTAAVALAAEQDGITRTRQARKQRTDALAIVAILAAATFVAGQKWQLASKGRGGLGASGLGLELNLSATHTRTLAQGSSLKPEAPSPKPEAPSSPVTLIDLAAVDELIARLGRSREAAIPLLQGIQAHYRYLPDEALRRVCELTDVTPAQIAGTSTFYAHLRRSPVGDHVVRVCHGTACHVSGARQIMEELRRTLQIPDGADTDPERRFTLDEVACLGCCSLAPVLMVDEQTAGRLTPASAVQALALARDTEPA